MLRELKFVQGAVAKKDLVPAMTHFRIENGTVRSYNGQMAICSPIALDIDCCPKADAMVKAIANCEDTTTISLTTGGKLSVRSGAFRALVPTIEGDTLHVAPAGEPVQFDGEHLLAAFKLLQPFVGTDASRPFNNGILLHGQSAFATNNVCMVEYWLGATFPFTVNIPGAAIIEVLRVDEAPTYAQIDVNSITFHFTDGKWIRSQLLTDQWPMDIVFGILDQPSNPMPINPELFTGIRKLKSFGDKAGRVYMLEGALRTSTDIEEAASYEIDLPFTGLYNMQMFSLLEGVVNSIDMSLYPGPCLFFGDRLRGAIIGMKM